MASGEWCILYHDAPFKGRAEFLRLMFEDAGVEYTESSNNLYGPTGICDAFRAPDSGQDGIVTGAEDHVAADTSPWPVMFPPILHHKPPEQQEVFINQTAAMMRYIAACLGYLPESAMDTARADQIMLDANDVMAEVNLAFHPVNPKASYESQKEQADIASKAYASSRLLVWLGHFEKLVHRLAPEGDGPLFGKMTYADFALFHVLDAAEAQFSSDFFGEAWQKAKIPTLRKWKEWVSGRPNLATYFASSRRRGWQGTSMM